MAYSSHYKDNIPETGKANKPKSAEPEKAGSTGKANRLKAFLNDERTKNVSGLSLMLLSVVMLLSFTSYLFTWNTDQDKLFGKSWWQIITDPSHQVENWLGHFGAFLGHVCINNGFGIASFAFVLLLFLLGFRMLLRFHLLPFWKTAGYSLFALIWTSVTLGALFHSNFLFAGGAFGYYTTEWMSAAIGWVGTFSAVIFSATVFAMVNFNFNVANAVARFRKPSADGTVNGMEVGSETEADDAPPLESITADTGASTVLFDEPETEPDIEPEIELLDDAETEFELEPENEITIADHFQKPAADESDERPELELVSDEEESTALAAGDGNFDDEQALPLDDYDPMLDLSRYQFPPIDLLRDHGDGAIQVERDELERNKNRIVDTLKNYNIGIAKIKATIGPTVTLYEIVPEAGVRISKIKNLEDDIALSLAALGIRIIAPIPGKGTIGIEVPNQNPDVVSMRTVIQNEKFQQAKMDLPIALGKTISNETFVTDLAKMPHLLMAGATGQGKSVGLNCILASLLYKKHPAQVKLVLVDPKKVELTLFNKIERHYLAKLPGEEEAIITDTSKVVNTLNSLCIEMDDRYELLKNAQCRNLKEYNAKFTKRKLNPNDGHRYLPYIVLVVDEFADLIMTAGKEVELPIARLAQLARAIGIHLIIATQRPSVNIITGTIKANFPSRIAFRVTSKIDSRTILDSGGAEQLIGRGDMLYSNGNDLIRLQCAFVDTPEIEDIVNFIGGQQGYPDAFLLPEFVGEGDDASHEAFEDMERDALFNDAARVVVVNQQGSASLLQRKMKLGYNRAGRIVDQLEAAGIIGPFEGSKARQVLISDEVSLERHLKSLEEKSPF